MTEVEVLRAAMRDIYELWAGSENVLPITPGERYLLGLIEEMKDIAAEHMTGATAA